MAQGLAYNPTWRDNARYTLGQLLGGGYKARDFSQRVMGSQSNAGLADFVPGVGGVFGAQEGGRTMKRGYQTGDYGTMAAGALGVGLSVLPEVGTAAALARNPAARAAGKAFLRDERGALNFKPGGDYIGGHTAPTRDGGAPLHSLSGDVYPEDIYSPQAARYYGTGSPNDAATMEMLQGLRGKPNAEVPIFRAVPKGVTDINANDWVSLDRQYAQQHGDSALGGNYDILSEKAKASDLFTSGDSVYEWGWSPQTPALTPPQQQAQSVLNLLKSGRASEVTDPMLDMGNATDNANMNAYLYKNYDLPMDTASRSENANKYWPDTVYHNTTTKKSTDLAHLDPDANDYGITKDTGIFTNTNKAAAETYGGRGRTTMELRAGNDNQYSQEFNNNALISPFSEKTFTLPDGTNINPRENAGIFRKMLEMGPDESARAARKMGASSIRQKNILDPGKLMREKKVPRGDNIVYFDGAQLRKPEARFDPRLKHLKNLLAGGGALTLGGYLNGQGGNDTRALREYLKQ